MGYGTPMATTWIYLVVSSLFVYESGPIKKIVNRTFGYTEYGPIVTSDYGYTYLKLSSNSKVFDSCPWM